MSDKVYTWDEVSEHITEKSCWLVINGNVIDVTDYLTEHPGSKIPLLKYAGEDASKPFQSVGHSKGASDIRDAKKIGVIEKNAPSKAYWLKVRSAKWELNKYTEQQVAEHNSEGDSWIIIGDYVYDFSTLNHPGGQKVINLYAGKDGTETFNSKDEHKANAQQSKERFRIGKVNRPQPKEAKKCPLSCVTGGFGLTAIVLVASAAGYFAYQKLRK